MSHAAYRLLSLRACLLLQVAVYITCCLPLVASAQIADEPALRHLAEEFFTAYQKEDLEKLMSMWSTRSPDLATSRKIFQETFAAPKKVELKAFAIRKLTLAGDQASVHVVFETSVDSTGTAKSATGSRHIYRTLHCAKEGAVWKVWQYVASEEELADALLSAQTDEKREALLAVEKELLTAELQSVLTARGRRLASESNYAQALTSYSLALRVAEQRGDKAAAASALRRMGNMHYLRNDHARAMEVYQKGMKLAEEIGEKALVAALLNNMALVYDARGNQAQALHAYESSIKLAEEIGDKEVLSAALNNVGLIHKKKGDYPRALESYRKSLKLSEQLGGKAAIAAALFNIGDIHYAQGDYAQSLQFFESSLKIGEELKSKPAIARAIRGIGRVHSHRNNYMRALEYYQESMKLAEELGDATGIASTLNDIGLIYKALGNLAQALEYYEKALKLAEELEQERWVAAALNNIGLVHEEQKNYTLALEFYQRSLKLKEKLGNREDIYHTLANIGSIHYWQGNYAQALETFQKSLQLAEELEDRPETIRVLGEIGYVHLAQENYVKALDFAERAVTLARQIGSPESLWGVRILAGKANRALNQFAQANQAFAEAITITESVRDQVGGGEEEQQRFFEDRVSPYYEAVDLMITQGNFAEALAYAERAKGRVLLDVLQSGRINVTKNMTQKEAEEEQRLKGELVSLNTQIYREKVSAQPDQNRKSDLNARLQKARLEFEAFQTSLYAAHPELKVRRGQTRPMNLDQASTLLTDNQTAFLEFVVTEEKTHLFVLTSGKATGQGQLGKPELRVYSLKIKRQELADEAGNFRRALSELDLEFRKPARRLYDLLLKPAEKQLQGKTRVCIVPDGPLWELPFQALQPAENRYLVEERAIFYTPSLSVLREMTKSSRRGRADETGFTRRSAKVVPVSDRFSPVLLAFGNPSLNTGTVTRVRAVHRDEKLEPLPEAEKEVRILERLYGPARSRVYIGADAREERAKSEMGQYRILQFATHGILDDQNPMYSNVLLSQAGDNEAEDGLLEAWEIMRLDLKADLTVLSACQTARGRVGAGEGIIGMSWAFFVAGSPTTVVSQWRVDSASTKQLMVEFHRRLLAGAAKEGGPPTKAEALRGAAVSLLKDRRYRHPFYWSGFVIVGDGR